MLRIYENVRYGCHIIKSRSPILCNRSIVRMHSAKSGSMSANEKMDDCGKRWCDAYRLGLIEYEMAWKWQKELIQERIRAKRNSNQNHLKDVVLLLQHLSVYTIGRGGSMANVKFNPASAETAKLIRVDRGGEVTYHGPGQLVAYPIMDLQFYRKDLHWYLRQVEEVVIRTLGEFNIKGERKSGLTGVWVDGNADDGERSMRKIAAVGTHASKWITMHGFALNVTTDLEAFDNIVPCGIRSYGVCSMEQYHRGITIEQVEEAVMLSFQQVFNVHIESSIRATPFDAV